MREQLLEFLLRQPQLSRDEALGFSLQWQTERHLARGEALNAPGRVEHHLWWVSEGLLRLFYPSDTDDICVGFSYENNLVCSFPSFVRRQPSQFSIEALADCHLIGISRTALDEAQQRWPGVTRFYATALEQAVTGIIEREIEIHTTSPEERYERLLARAPHLFQRVPLKYLASYLRIRPETLSRVRARK